MNTKIPWQLAIPDSVITEYAGSTMREYFRNPRVMLQSQQKANARFGKLFGIRRGLRAGRTTYMIASTLGLKVFFPRDNDPQVAMPRVLASIKDVDQLRPPAEPAKSGLVPDYLAMHRYFCDKICLQESYGYNVGFQGPFTTAALLRGEELFEEIYTDPRRVHLLLEIITENSLRLAQSLKEKLGAASTPVVSISATDDYAGLISPEHYEEFEYPYLKRLYDSYSVDKRHLHAETLHTGHLAHLSKLGVTQFDPGMDQYLSIESIKSSTNVHFSWNLHTVRDMLQGNPESVKAIYERSIEAGAPAMMTEICRATPIENIKTFVETARRFE